MTGSQGTDRPPGWYPDPHGGQWWRWWDGSIWTEHNAPFHPAPPHSPPAPGVPAVGGTGGALPSINTSPERALAPWAQLCAVAYPVLLLVASFLGWVYASWWRQYLHYVRVLLTAVSHGNKAAYAPPLQPASYRAALSLIGACQIVLTVVFLVWQYRAACAARDLGYPARRSPWLGIVGWLVPVINFWFPYQAIRDCLPPGHGARYLALRGWILFIATGIASQATTFVIVYHTAAGFILLSVTALMAGALALSALGVIAAIGENHRQSVAGGPHS